MADDDHTVKTGRLARLAKLASMSAKLSGEVVARGVQRLTGSEGPQGLMGAGAAEKLVATLGDLKGLAMKLGQQISMDPDLLTPEVRAIVARLQNQAPPMPWATVEGVLRSELGAARSGFAEIDPTPLAAASLGQVHRARTTAGDDVVVKVQYPDIARALKSDLENLGAMVAVFSASTRLTQGKGYYEELRDSMFDELDYREEGRRARAFALAAQGLPDVQVPKVFESLTSERVLTLERLAGRTYKEFLGGIDQVDAAEKFRASRLLMRAIWGPFLRSGSIHADPHPGNYVLLDDGRVGVLDFGAVKQLSPAWTRVNRELFTRVCADEPCDVIALSLESGFVFDDPVGARPFVQTVLDIATRPPRTRDFDFKGSSISRDMRNHFITHATQLGGMKPPKESVQFFRAIGGLSQNLENIGARGDFRAVYEEMRSLIPR
jgi:predicted unusual protein kinase regulating ubiquinone biosynthesis (AarF/ABC1/UbiB family)